MLDELAARHQYSGTSLESFAVCSYRWFVERELSPQPLGPVPEPVEQGNLMHSVLEALYRERPGGDPVPRHDSLAAWIARGGALVAEKAADAGLSGDTPAERALRRRVDLLLAAFLRREAARDPVLLTPELLEATFGDSDGGGKPPLDLGGWELRGRIDRVDVDSAGGLGLLHDYKVSSKATPCAKFSDEGKLQLPLYLLALRDLWGIEPAGGLYQPLRATRQPRPRGMVRASADAELAGYALVSTDRLDEERFEACLEEARATASAAVGRIRAGQIDRDPRDNECPRHCGFAPICRRERGIVPELLDEEEQPELAA